MMNLDGRYTLKELEMFFHSTPDRIRLAMLLAADHSERLKQVEAAVDWIALEHSKTRQHRHDRDEDGLTTDIITDLKAMGFDASHDKDYGGHSDIVIEARGDFLWLGEAKIHRDYDWLLKGFQQLDTRYATAVVGQDRGGLIIYCKGKRVDQVMVRWCEYLLQNRPDMTIAVCAKNPLNRRSSHPHERTGLPFEVRHIPISLYFDPKDSGDAD
jgi:hypothetical protein